MSETRLGFGCAGLMQSPSGRHRQRLLAEAYEQGIRHFDVARMYGLGSAERELGKFARGRRESIFIATKFGIDPSARARQLARLQAPARAVLARVPALKNALRRRESAFHEFGTYTPEKARSSLETSLRELGTDRVDLFLVHGPQSEDSIAMNELGETLEELRSAGLIGSWGLAGEPSVCRRLAAESGCTPVLQLRDDVLAPAGPWRRSSPQPISYGVLSRALSRIAAWVSRDDAVRREWSTAIGVDCGDSEALAVLLLRDALERNREGTVLFSTTRTGRIAAARQAESEQGPGDLEAFRSRVLAAVRGGLGGG